MAALKREYDYSVDYGSFTQAVMPEVWRRIEARVYPLAKERGLEVGRAQKVVKTAAGAPVGGVQNITWSARKGLSAGFTVELEHSPQNYLHVKVEAKPYYPIAYLISVVLGLVISYIWIPYLFSNWSMLTSNYVFIGLVVLMWILFVYLTHTIFLSGFLAIASTVAFGFVAGFAVGWGVGHLIGDSHAGGKIQPALAAVIEGLEQPAGGFGSPTAYAPLAQPVLYATQVPPSPRPYAPAPPPPPQWAQPPAPEPRAPAASSQAGTAPCPRCGKGVTVGAASCSWCGLALVW